MIRSVFSTAAALGLAASVTAGSMYVNSRAAVNDENAEQAVVAEAGIAPDKIRSDRSHEIVLDASGAFTGQLFSIVGTDATAPGAGLMVRVLQKGGVSAETTTDGEGRFSVSGLTPGVAGIIARGDGGMMLIGVRLVAATPDKPAELEVDLQSALIDADDVGLAKELIRSQIGDSDERFSAGAGADDEKYAFGKGEASTGVVGYKVQLGQDGILRGIVNVLDERTGRNREVMDETVYFLENGQVIGSGEVNADGSFAVAGLQPGIYSVIGAGRDGVFAMGVEVVAFADVQAQLKRDGYAPVAVLLSLDMAAAPIGPANLNSENLDENLGDESSDSSPPPAPTPAAPAGGPAGGGGSGAGGGGAGGAGGGLGALIGAGIGAGVGYALGQDDNGPSSPGI